MLEPYYGGSHQQFIEGLVHNIKADFTVLKLPARKWKMRMQLSAIWFAEEIEKSEDHFFDTVLCSTFVDVAVLRVMLRKVSGWNEKCRFCTYYHENQFSYPNRIDASWYQFAAINFHSACASDAIAFNSWFNEHSFFEGCESYLDKSVDMHFDGVLEKIRQKSTVIYPGIECPEEIRPKTANKFPVICWNHRWEHDKNPDEFFHALFRLKEEGRKFRVVILGQSFAKIPDIFTSAKERLKDEILHFGHLQSRDEYLAMLHRADLVVSTSIHEFFGISVLEAVAAGCMPLVPERLSYPELYPAKCIYGDNQLIYALREFIDTFPQDNDIRREMDVLFCTWGRLKDTYQRWLLPDNE